MKSWKQYVQMLEDWVPKDASLAIAADGQYVYYQKGVCDIYVKEGSPVPAGSLAEKTILTGCKTESVMDDSLFGVPYYGVGYPIEVEGKPAALVIILPPRFGHTNQETYRFLTGKQDDEWTPVAIENVHYIESMQKKTWFYAGDQQYTTNRTLKELHGKLPDSFIRIHRSYIVNISCIDKIARDFSSNFVITLKDGNELPVSQKYIGSLRTALGF